MNGHTAGAPNGDNAPPPPPMMQARQPFWGPDGDLFDGDGEDFNDNGGNDPE